MRTTIGVAICAVVAYSTLPAQKIPTPDTASAAGVANLLTRFDASGSAAGTLTASARAGLFSNDAIFINAFGDRHDGRPAIDSIWARLYSSTTFDSSRIRLMSRRQRLLGPGLMLVDHIECLTGQRGPNSGRELPPRMIHITLLIRKEPDAAWRIAYYRAGDVRELARNPSSCTSSTNDSLRTRPAER